MSVLFVPQLKISPRVAGVFHYAIGFLWSTLNSAFAPFVLLVSDIKWNGPDRTGWSKNVIAVVRGLLIVAPLVVYFRLDAANRIVRVGTVRRLVRRQSP